jgi:hypothetical protein
MSHVVLLGDSIFDNAAYVRGGPAVIDQVRERMPDGWRATLCAVDGSVIEDVHGQLERMPDGPSHLVVSVGGNDALGKVDVLGERVNSVGEGLGRLAGVVDRFERDYRRLLRAIVGRGVPAAVCTIYDPRFPDVHLQRQAETALRLFNDAIVLAAREFRLPVIELRTICTADEDYANPIEPSAIGGAKIARAIGDLVLGV